MKRFTFFSDRQPARRTIPFAAMAALTTLAMVVPQSARADDLLFDFYNVGPVKNSPWFISLQDHVPMTVFSISDAGGWKVTSLVTYHFENGVGLNPNTHVTFALKDTHLHAWTFVAHNVPGSANWEADVNMVLPKGSYSVEDSAFNSWSYNDRSVCSNSYCGPGNTEGTYGEGFLRVFGTHLAPPPPPPPPPPPAPSPFAAPCTSNSGALTELARPDCFGAPGSPLNIVVLRQLNASTAITGIAFHAPKSVSTCLVTAGMPPSGAAVAMGVTLRSGNGTSPGSTFSSTVPAGLCRLTGRGDWTWEVDQLTPNPFSTPSMGCYIVVCQ